MDSLQVVVLICLHHYLSLRLARYTTTPQSNQAPRLISPLHEYAPAQSLKHRQEWLIFERIQEQSIRQFSNRMKTLVGQIVALNSRNNLNGAKPAGAELSWRTVFSFKSARLSEQEKNDIKRQLLDSGDGQDRTDTLAEGKGNYEEI